MVRYIDREIAIKTAVENYKCNNHIDAVELVEAMESIPTADVVEVRHGEWKEIRNAYGELEGWLCECGRESKIKENYCPNCGADMRGE